MGLESLDFVATPAGNVYLDSSLELDTVPVFSELVLHTVEVPQMVKITLLDSSPSLGKSPATLPPLLDLSGFNVFKK